MIRTKSKRVHPPIHPVLKALIFIGAALLATVAGIIIFWLKSDPTTWRDALTRLASEQLQRQLTIAGDLKPGFSFARGLTLEITDLRLANAPGFQPAAMLIVPNLEITVDVRALFSNTIHVRGMKMTGATLNLAQKEDGADNWSFKSVDNTARPVDDAPAARLSNGRIFSFAAERVLAEDTLIDYIAPGDHEQFQVEALELQAPARKDFKLKASLQHNQLPYVFSFNSGSLKTLLEGTRQPVALQLQTTQHFLSLDGNYSRHDNLYRFDSLQARIDGMWLNGEVIVTMAEPHPRITMALSSQLLELPASQAVGPYNAPAWEGPLFSRTPLPWSLLSSLDLDGTLKVARLTQGNKELGPLHLTLQLAQSQLAATAIAQPPGAGQPIKLNVLANASQQASIALAAPALDPSLWAGFLGTHALVQSPASISLNLAGHGAAPHDLAASASGHIAFAAQPGSLNVAAIPDGVRRTFDAVLGADALDHASLACLKADFTVQDGIMEAGGDQSGVGLDSNILAVSGEGQADLGMETIALRLVAVPKLPGLGQTLVPLHITGSLADPRMGADLAATAGQVAGQVFERLANTLPSARIGLATAKALGHDPKVMIAQPRNPCIETAAPATGILPAPDAATAPSPLPPEVQQKLKGARDLLNQFIQAAEPPPAPAGSAQ